MSSKKKVVAVAITTAALSISAIGMGNAATKTTVKKTTVTRTANQTGVANPMANGARTRGPQATLASTLAALVTKGTITQAQADAITAALAAAEAAEHANDPIGAGPMGGKGGLGGFIADKLTIVSSVLGIDSATITSKLASGSTLATIAGDKKAALITALIAEETKQIDAAVTAGRFTAAQATAMKADLTAHVTAFVEGTVPPMGAGPMGGMHDKGGKGGRGGHGPMGGSTAAPKIPAPSTSATPKA